MNTTYTSATCKDEQNQANVHMLHEPRNRTRGQLCLFQHTSDWTIQKNWRLNRRRRRS